MTTQTCPSLYDIDTRLQGPISFHHHPHWQTACLCRRRPDKSRQLAAKSSSFLNLFFSPLRDRFLRLKGKKKSSTNPITGCRGVDEKRKRRHKMREEEQFLLLYSQQPFTQIQEDQNCAFWKNVLNMPRNPFVHSTTWLAIVKQSLILRKPLVYDGASGVLLL